MEKNKKVIENPLKKLLPDGGYCSIFRSIVCVGDSLSSGEFQLVKADGTYGYYDLFDYSWGQYIARMIGGYVQNFSRGGMTAKQYCESFAEANGFWERERTAQAYIIALGINDLINFKHEMGSPADIDWKNYENNKKTFVGHYAKIMQKYREISPQSILFLVTMPKSENEEENAVKEAHADMLYELAKLFPKTFVIDLFRFAPVHDELFRKQYYLYGHLNPCGYVLTAKQIATYIDYIIRHNLSAFEQVGMIGKAEYSLEREKEVEGVEVPPIPSLYD